MVKIKRDCLTSLGLMIEESGLSLNYIIEKTGITRNRLVALRTSSRAILAFNEVRRLAWVLKMSLDEFAEEYDKKENILGSETLTPFEKLPK